MTLTRVRLPVIFWPATYAVLPVTMVDAVAVASEVSTTVEEPDTPKMVTPDLILAAMIFAFSAAAMDTVPVPSW